MEEKKSSKFYAQHSIRKNILFFTVCTFIRNKEKTKKSHVHEFSCTILTTLLAHLWQQFTAAGLFEYNVTSSALVALGSFAFFFLYTTSQAPSGWTGAVVAQPLPDLARHFQM